jgi:two-component system cell cycle response regulator
VTNTPRLLDQLSALTAIRDLELLEFSLLKTLHYSFRPLGLVLLRLDAKGRPQTEIRYGEQQCIVKHEGIDIPGELESAIAYLKATEAREYVISGGATLQAVYTLHLTRSSSIYLIIATADQLSKLDAHLVAGMLQIYRNFCQLLRDSQTDQLTGLANRKTFDECVNKIYDLITPDQESVPNERRAGAPSAYWLAMVDIDHFKVINDRFGHLYGDEVLVLLGQMLKSAFREDDLIFRFGGEEFVLMIRCADQDASRRALERLRRSVAEHVFPQVGKVTISIGATRFTRETFAVTLLDYADQALYFSKKNGRDQVTFFEDMLAQGIATEEEIKPGSIDFF